MMNKSYGLTVTIPDNEVIIDKTTGMNLNKNRLLHANIEYSGSLFEPNIKLALYRRSYVGINDTNYNLVDLSNYVNDNLTSYGTNTKIYNLIDELDRYDDDAYVGNIIKYIIIK